MKKIFRLLISAIILSFGLTLLISPYVGQKASALSGGEFQAGRIIDDVIFTNKDSMNVQQIQAFLNSKVPTCWVDHPIYTSPSSGNTYYPPYTCLKDYQENPATAANNYGQYNPDGTPASVAGGISAAQIIWNASQEYNINPQSLIVLLQKEQGLVTDDWPILPQYQKATGYACDDSGGINTCASSFYQQVNDAAWQYRNDLNGISVPGAWGAFGLGWNNIPYHPNAACSTKSVYIQNKATAVLYKYTPYTPNDAALNNLYGPGDGCSAYGNRNFWRYFNDWFGSTFSNPLTRGDGSPISLSSNQDGRLTIVGVASNDNIYYKTQASANSDSWSPWVQMYGALRNLTNETNEDGRIQIVGVASNGNIYSRSQTSANSDSWSPWVLMEGALRPF
jgi:hypothetical protein